MRLGAFFLAWLCANHLDKAPPIGVLCSLTIGLARKLPTHIKQTIQSTLGYFYNYGLPRHYANRSIPRKDEHRLCEEGGGTTTDAAIHAVSN